VEQAVQDLSHVEVCLNCSSRTLRMVTDVFYYALKSVLYPLQPLYDR
jgi:Ras family protein T1